MPILDTCVQHSTGSPGLSNQARKITGVQTGKKPVTVCRQHDTVCRKPQRLHQNPIELDRNYVKLQDTESTPRTGSGRTHPTGSGNLARSSAGGLHLPDALPAGALCPFQDTFQFLDVPVVSPFLRTPCVFLAPPGGLDREAFWSDSTRAAERPGIYAQALKVAHPSPHERCAKFRRTPCTY